MPTLRRSRTWYRQLLAALAVGFAITSLGVPAAKATIMTYYWTDATNVGFVAYTAANRKVDLWIESDVTVGGNGYWYGTNADSVYTLELNRTLGGNCVSSQQFTVDTQHTAIDPVTSEYEWQTSGDTGTCP